MVALDFPDTPTVGQVFDRWTWNGTVWVLTAGSAGAVIATNQTGIAATMTNLTGYTLTINVVAGRMYEATWSVTTQQISAAGQQIYRIRTDVAVTDLLITNVVSGGVETQGGAVQFVGGTSVGGLPNATPGSRTIFMQASTSAGTMNTRTADIINGRFAIKDVGAV